MVDKVAKKKNKSGLGDSILGFDKDSWKSALNDDSSEKKRLTPSEKIKMIEASFEDILGRKPDNRELNYYKYSSLSEEDVRNELVNSKEHKKLIKNGQEYKEVKASLDNTKTRIKVLESQIKDQEESFKELNKLIKEKNKHIEELREQLKSPFERRCSERDDNKSEKLVQKEAGNEVSKFERFVEKILSLFN